MSKFRLKLNTDSFDRIMDMSPCLKQTVQVALVDSMVEIKKQWENLAKSSLRSSKNAYINGLSIQMSKDGYSGSIVLQGDLPVKLEKGSPPYDLKALFAVSSKVKFNKQGGWYMDIPIRQGTPNSTQLSSTLNNSVYTLAKKLPSWGVLRTDQGSMESWTGYQYHNTTYDYLTKIPSGTPGGRSSYMIWRRVSENSDPMSWWHPGFTGVHLADQIAPLASSILEKTVVQYINKVFDL